MNDSEFDAEDVAGFVRQPTLRDAADRIVAALGRGQAVSLVGRWEVTDADDRPDSAGSETVGHVLVKPDGSVVVHDGSGTAATAVLDAGTEFDVDLVGGGLRIPGGDRADGRRLVVDAVGSLTWFRADAGVDPNRRGPTDDDPPSTDRPAGGHDALVARVLTDPDRVEPGFRPLATERGTGAGPIDVFGRDDAGRAVVLEVKAHCAGPAAVGQLDRYVEALRRDLHADAEVRGILVAPAATERTRTLLADRGYGFSTLPPVD